MKQLHVEKSSVIVTANQRVGGGRRGPSPDRSVFPYEVDVSVKSSFSLCVQMQLGGFSAVACGVWSNPPAPRVWEKGEEAPGRDDLWEW